ncbi:MAG: GntR family transcriptional regulator [Chitinivibrionales bacterium]|nr:GntR family transcriptional regulator [Chitinivibrionales bacterium]
MRSERPGQRAYEYLRTVVARHHDSPHTPLPGVRALAREAGVSMVTMQRALTRAKNERIVTTRPGNGTFVATPTDDAPPSPEPPRAEPNPLPKWRYTARTLHRDLVNRVYAPNSLLPPARDLARRYAVCAPTMRKVLAYLVEIGAVRHDVGGYRCCWGTTARMYASVCLIIHGSGSFLVDPLPERERHLINALADQCRSHGIHLDLCPVEYDRFGQLRPDRPFHSYATNRPCTRFLGFLVMGSWLGGSELLPLLRECASSAHNVVLLDALGDVTEADLRDIPGAYAVGYSYSRAPGLAVGRLLLGLGHRDIVYIDESNPWRWSCNRYRGLRDSVAEAGVDAIIQRVEIPQWDDPRDAPLDDFFAGDATRCMTSEKRRRAMERILERFKPDIEQAWRPEMQLPLLRRTLSSLLRESVATAWVISSGSLADRCLRYLHERGIRPPQRVSLATFDDLQSHRLYECTSYNFDMPGVARAALDLVVLPCDEGVPTHRCRVFEPQGFLSIRSSTERVQAVSPGQSLTGS